MESTLFKKGVEVYHNTKAKIYPDGGQKITVCSQPIFKSEYLEPVDFCEPVSKVKDMSHEVRPDSVRRAKQKVFDIARCNKFDYFITWTLDKEKIDRYNPLEVSRKLKFFLNNSVKRYNALYLVVPEYHKDGAIHIHGLLRGDFETIPFKPLPDGRMVYNMPQWSLGYSTAIELDNQYNRVASYITKYVEKDFRKIFGSFYYAGGHGLIRSPDIHLYDIDYDQFNTKEYGKAGIWYKYLDVDAYEK